MAQLFGTFRTFADAMNHNGLDASDASAESLIGPLICALFASDSVDWICFEIRLSKNQCSTAMNANFVFCVRFIVFTNTIGVLFSFRCENVLY